MKTALILVAICSSLVSCVTPPGSSVASLGAGSDAAYLNANRGRADAQISSGQATQYSRQRNQVSEEMQLEQQKRQNTIQNSQGVLNLFGTASSFVR